MTPDERIAAAALILRDAIEERAAERAIQEAHERPAAA